MEYLSRPAAILALASPVPNAPATGVVAPGSSATIDIFSMPVLGDWVARADVSIVSSHDSGASGVLVQATFDNGTNWDTVASYTYSAATGLWTYSVPRIGVGMRVRYTNSANVLTTFRGEVRFWSDRAMAV